MAQFLDKGEVFSLLSAYGYEAVFLIVAMESMGVLLPGEAILVSAAVYAGDTHNMRIDLIVLSASLGAIFGDNVGFWIGRTFGLPALKKFGPEIGLDDRKLKLGQYLFMRWGGAVVFFGRFIALLRVLTALLAGVNRLEPTRFFLFNAAGGIIWACLFGYGGYLFGAAIHDVVGPLGWTVLVFAIIGGLLLWCYFKRHEEELLVRAEAAVNKRDSE
jgi:membrane protein DedA with SNARE-associated domain